jgi:cytochrome c oxidase cbb3-type subunit 3/ubiquinol-cytochrome c reductase cytochrome c subunit
VRSALALALALLLAACDALPGKPTEADRPLRPEQVRDFATLYGDNCAGCHGADGKLAAARPLNDPLYLAVAGADRLRQITAGGVAGSLMPGFAISAGGTLTDQQIGILVDQMMARWGGAPPAGVGLPAYAASGAGDAQRGQAAYATNCAGCHGADGSGGAKGGSVVDGSFLALVSDQALRTAVICGRTDLGMPDWRGDGSRPMSEQEITDVVAWLIAQRPKFPGQPYAAAELR